MYHEGQISYEPVPLPDRREMDDAEMAAAAEAFLSLMKGRHSVRDFDTRPVAQEVIARCVETAGRAPSGANHQPWHFVAIADPAMKAELRGAAEAEDADQVFALGEEVYTTCNNCHMLYWVDDADRGRATESSSGGGP